VDISAWLHGLGLQQYEQAFRDNAIDASVLHELTPEDLNDLGVSLVGHRRKLLAAIGALRSDEDSEPEGTAAASAGERRQLTVMFCDLVGSTALSARVDPEEMHDVVERYYGAIADAVAQFDGFIARYLGDGALVYFGWPQADESDAERAIRAGLALVAAVQAITADPHKLQVRIGIATGLVVIGNTVGVGAASEQLAVGDTLNLAARLQAVAAPDSVVIADATRRVIGRLFDLEPIGPLDLKGIPGPTIAWQVRGEGAEQSRFAAVRGGKRAKLIGREAEIALLVERWHQASQGCGSAVVLVGEAGIGKSRVAHELLDRLADRPHRRALLQCSPLHISTALYPVIRHLDQAIGGQMDDTPEQRLDKLTARLDSLRTDRAGTPLLAELLSLPGATEQSLATVDPRQHKARMLGALVDYFLAQARQQPLVMLLEDAHWIDPTTRDLVGELLARIEQVPMLLIVTARPGFASFAGGDRVCAGQMMHRLEPAEADRLLRQVVGDKRLPPELAEEVLVRTDGVPLFIEELMHSLFDSGQLVEHADEWRTAGRLVRAAIPATLQDSLMSRLDRLGASKEMAQLGAVLGREFSVPLLAAVAGFDPRLITDHLDRLVQTGLLFRDGSGADTRYVFRHALIQDAAYEGMLLSRRRQLHARVAEALEEQFPGIAGTQPELVARHYTAAGRHDAAVTWWQRAAENSLHRSANVEAIEHCSKCLEILPLLPEGPARDACELDIRIQLGVALSGTRGYTAPEWEANTSRLVALAERIDSTTAKLIPVLWHQWVGVFSVADMGGALTLAERMLAFAERSGERTALMVGHRVLGASLVGQGLVSIGRTHLENALAYHDAEKDAPLAYVYALDQRLSAMGYLSLALIQCGYPDQGMRVSDAARADALRLNLPTTTGLTLSLRLGAHMLRRDQTALKSTAEELIELMARHHHRGREVLAHTVLALLEARQIGGEAPLVTAHSGIEELQCLHWNFWIPWLLLFTAEIRLENGQHVEAARLIEQAEALIEPTQYILCMSELLRLRARLFNATEEGAPAAAQQLRRAIDIARGQGARLPELRAATELAQLLLYRGDDEAARSALEPIVASFTEGFGLADVRHAKQTLALLQRQGDWTGSGKDVRSPWT
jgi:class 3 adenylate cyclase